MSTVDGKEMVNKQKVEEAVKMLLDALGEDTEREGLVDTPARVARMYEELLAGRDSDASEHLGRQFEYEGSGDYVLEKDITFYSLCEHHMLPFFGKVHIAYVPGEKIVGLSKLARTVEVFARRLQVQERLTDQIADAVMTELNAKGVLVVVEAEHTCMTMRGVKKPGSVTMTSSTRGCFEDDRQLKSEVMQMIVK